MLGRVAVAMKRTTGSRWRAGLWARSSRHSLGTGGPGRARLARYGAIAAFVAGWQLSGVLIPPIYISTPLAVARDFLGMLFGGLFLPALAESLLEFVLGLLAAIVLGIGSGIMLGRIRALERMASPLVAFGNATPAIALLPLMELWFGIGRDARVAFIATLAVWTLLINTMTGIGAVDQGVRDVGKTVGMGPWTQTWKIYVPASLPYIFAALRIAVSLGALGMILGGQEIGQAGLGGLSVIYGSYYETGNLVATVVSTTLLAMVFYVALKLLQAVTCPWIAAQSAKRR